MTDKHDKILNSDITLKIYKAKNQHSPMMRYLSFEDHLIPVSCRGENLDEWGILVDFTKEKGSFSFTQYDQDATNIVNKARSKDKLFVVYDDGK